MKCFITILMCVAMADAIELTLEEYKQHWQEWKSFYGKTYESEAVNSARFAVWKNNLKVNIYCWFV